jgi:Tol biopolymer transport system component
VVALVYEVCRAPAAAFPQSSDDLWITDTGEVLVARPDRAAVAVDPREGVATLLETLMPKEDDDAARGVPASLRGLPARLRSSVSKNGGLARDRKDLMAILQWHLGDDPRRVIQQLAQRATQNREDAAVAAGAVTEDLDLFLQPATVPPAPPSPAALARAERRTGVRTALTSLTIGLLFITIGAVSYWLFRQAAPETVEPSAPAPAAVVERVVPRRAPAAVDTPGERPLQLDVIEGAFSPAFATSGQELIFHAGRVKAGRLLMASLDDQGQVSRVSAIVNDGSRNYHPRVSPDGRLLAFDSDREGERGVFVSARDGSNARRVSGPGYGAVPSWSPTMTHLAFIRAEPARPRVWNLWLRELSSGAMQRHTSYRSGQVWGASWFPDGRSFAYSHDRRFVISHLDGRPDIVVDTPRRGHLVRTPAVSPDGRRVVFQVFGDGVWMFDVASGSMRRILDDASAEEFAWAPDGQRIAYHSRRDGEWKIWVMNVAG